MAANTYLAPEERAALESVRVGIAGAGGLGSNCAMHLVRSGVKHITIADFDVVNESNLNRQFFFRDQIGQKKVEAIKANLLRIEPDADIRAVDIRLDASSAREIFADCGIDLCEDRWHRVPIHTNGPVVFPEDIWNSPLLTDKIIFENQY